MIALGLALGPDWSLPVTAVSSGDNTAQAKVVHALYGVGTDLTVTESPAPPALGHLPPGVCLVGSSCPSVSSPTHPGNDDPRDGGTGGEAPSRIGGAGGFTLNYLENTAPGSGRWGVRVG